ncbi:methyltransferase type 12 [Methylobacterium sp. Leaf399]|uniref:class I SAM-dependent DNA methyltransferase n=1 Tax=Methylobacterium sp. Leaf399 TaxID=1736364 RepID=UPI0006F369ED|nr:methyltransferase domain-containing protein [Methylobacterium sp. Leaf399]KQT09148.1 methyltransferase type 12 [Methylobacterium sp. Leaf399]
MTPQTSSGDLLADRRYGYGAACLAEGDVAAAAEMAEQTLGRAPRFAPAWFLLGRAREAQHRAGGDEGAFHAALRAYANALDLDPEDGQGARLHLARMGEGAAMEAITPAYVRALFDGYAPRFERHLVDDLHYRGPSMLVAALDRAAGAAAPFAVALDLGCGTGLVGEALGGRVAHLTGVDLSPGMLAHAERAGRYRRLVAGDLRSFLATEPAGAFDLVVSADVFIYVGDLAAVLCAIARVLRVGGYAAFTVQSPPGPGVELGQDGRYAHGEGALSQAIAAAGLDLRLAEEAAIRRESDADVPGRVVVLRRPDPGAASRP